jgi:hypothetical protein
MIMTRYLFASCPQARVRREWFLPGNSCFDFSILLREGFLSEVGEIMDLETFLGGVEEHKEYEQMFYYLALGMWSDLLIQVERENPYVETIEIHFFSERSQRPFFFRVNLGVGEIHGYSPFHVAFFDNHDPEYIFNKERYRTKYQQVKTMESYSMRDLMNDMDIYGWPMRF